MGEDISALTPRVSPSDELVEIVARSMYDRRPLGRYPTFQTLTWEEIGPGSQDERRSAARAAIEAYQKATGGDPRGVRESKSSPPPPALEGVEEELRAVLAKAIPTRGDTIELQMSEGAALLSALAGNREENERLTELLAQAHVRLAAQEK